MVVYDIMDLGKQLKTMGLLVITDAMLNRVTENWKKGKRTHIFLDEFHVVFENEYSGEQMSYITNADAGCGLIKYGSFLVPFINKFPRNTRLYKLMTTKPGEDSVNRNR